MAPYLATPIDVHVKGYWRLDEVNDVDPAKDLAGSSTLVFVGSAQPQFGRVGYARELDGLTGFGTATDSVPFRLLLGLSITTWARLNTVNSLGSKLRTLLAFDGAGAGIANATAYSLAVDDTGAIVYRHDNASNQPVILKTAAGLVRTDVFFCYQLTRSVAGPDAVVTVLLNGEVVPWASATVNGVPAPTSPVPAPGVITAGSFKIGVSAKAPDSFWHGTLDEMSVHDVARSATPYLKGEFLRVALSDGHTRYLSNAGTLKSLGAVDLPNGSRWWCYERERSLFVVHETSAGFFEPEVQLTTGGVQPNGAPVPGGTAKPQLIYDAASDSLVIAFISAGRVYTITGIGTDVPATLNMPLTSDTAGIVKARDATDAMRIASGMAQRSRFFGNDNTPTAATVMFFEVPSFGLVVLGTNPYGYAIVRRSAGHDAVIGMVTSLDYSRPEASGTYFFFPILTRVYGDGYRALPIRQDGTLGTNASNIAMDYLGEASASPLDDFRSLVVNRDGDLEVEPIVASAGEASTAPNVGKISRSPVKFLGFDTEFLASGSKELPRTILHIPRTPFKLPVLDTGNALSSGASTRLRISRTGQRDTQD